MLEALACVICVTMAILTFCGVFVGLIIILINILDKVLNCGDIYSDYQIYKQISKRRLLSIKMKINRIKILYNLNPERWKKEGSGVISYYSDEGKITVYTSFFGYLWLKYKSKHKEKMDKKNKRNQKERESLEKIIRSSQKDIDSLQKKADNQIRLAEKVTNQVKKNIEK